MCSNIRDANIAITSGESLEFGLIRPAAPGRLSLTDLCLSPRRLRLPLRDHAEGLQQRGGGDPRVRERSHQSAVRYELYASAAFTGSEKEKQRRERIQWPH